MNDAQLKALIKKGKPVNKSIGRGLYFRISEEGTPFWVLRYTFNKKRKQYTIGRYGNKADEITLADAPDKAAEVRKLIKDGKDPVLERKRPKKAKFKTVDDIAQKWLRICERDLKHPHIPARVYKKEIFPRIGQLAVSDVEPTDILAIVESINDSGRPTISNDALAYCKQIFDRAVVESAIKYNPAAAISIKHAGGKEKARTRKLSFDEVEIVFKVLSENSDQFTRENYIALLLLLCLGVRKGELISAKWQAVDLEKKTWLLMPDGTKTEAEIIIPLPDKLIALFEELKVRSLGSDYLFPNRRASQRRKYISDDTLNHALAKLFGKKVGSKNKPFPNVLGKAGIEYFVVHDLRRTCRSLLSSLGIPPHIAERCLNHKIKGVEGIYDRHDYFEERKEALEKLAVEVMCRVN
ncbi:tyrosine-type recombinase/integrase [Thalassotalea euphylliae]|uniref:Site-specific integrase n=1 Tax=Thalassotalea euphylliae TaxID=1655234 RepID=A0A3E0UBE7_9GAMM|nr:site-specific integrase [Thalassotalea euphylliae]REL34044.1 site-specific integrase [Thalassotalea euphylliae]